MNRSRYTLPSPAQGAGYTATGIRTPALFPLAVLAFNELGVPDFQWWRDLFQKGIKPEWPVKISPGKGGDHCRYCGYPMPRDRSECGRCGMGRAA